jgi:hypothetical protein
MTIRSGMTDLVSHFRSYVQESGTVIFSDDRIQQILDSNSNYFYQDPLAFIPQRYNGSVIYTQYFSQYQWLEGTATTTNKIYNTNGTVVTNYSSDFVNGKFTFDANTHGTAYYFDGRSFNFFKAVSDGWKEKAAYYSTQFDFEVEGRKYKKSQIVQSCLTMAEDYASKATAVFHPMDRGDMC